MLTGLSASVRLWESSPLLSNTNRMAQSVSGRGAGAVGGESLLLLVTLSWWCRHLPYRSHIGRGLVVGVVGVGLGVSGEIVGEGEEGVGVVVVIELIGVVTVLSWLQSWLMSERSLLQCCP